MRGGAGHCEHEASQEFQGQSSLGLISGAGGAFRLGEHRGAVAMPGME